MASSPSSLPFWCWNSECPRAQRTGWITHGAARSFSLSAHLRTDRDLLGESSLSRRRSGDGQSRNSVGESVVSFLSFTLSLCHRVDWRQGPVVVHHVTLCSGQYLPWSRIYGAMESDSF